MGAKESREGVLNASRVPTSPPETSFAVHATEREMYTHRWHGDGESVSQHLSWDPGEGVGVGTGGTGKENPLRHDRCCVPLMSRYFLSLPCVQYVC